MDTKHFDLLDRAANRLYEDGCMAYWEAVVAAKAEIQNLRRELAEVKETKEPERTAT